MQIKFPATNRFRFARHNLSSNIISKALAALVAFLLFAAPEIALAQNQSTTTTTQPSQSASPAGTSTQSQQQPQPGAPPAPTTQLPPNAGTAPLNPSNQAQQSAQPQPGPQQQRQQTAPNTTGPQPISPQTHGQQPANNLPTTSTPAGTAAPQNTNATPTTPATGGVNGITQAPGQNIGVSTGAAPAVLPPNPPPVAPNYQAPERPLPSADRIGVDVSNQTPITLREAITLALSNNNDIDASRNDVKIAEYNLQAARGVYDPLTSSESYYERRTTPTSSTIGGGSNGSVTQTDPTATLRFGGYSPVGGGSYQVDFSSTRLTTNNQFVTLNPQYPTAFTATYTQPLWRGLRFDLNRHNIEIAKKNLSLSDAQFRQRAIDTITQVEQSYWDLVFALRSLQVQIDAVKQARTQVESNQRLVAQGVLAPIDIVAATTQVTTFEQSVYTAQEAVTRAENTLKTLILPDRTAALWSNALTPITPVTLDAPSVPLEQAVSAALTNRPELAQLKTNSDINQIDVRYYREQTKPQIDLVGTYSPAGLSGALVPQTQTSSRGTSPLLVQRVNDLSALAGLLPLPASTTSTTTVPPNLIGGYQQSLLNLFEQRYPTVNVGVRVSLPLRNRVAKANLGRSLTQGAKINDQLAQMRQQIEADVRNNMQAVRSAQARLASAAAARSSAEQQYASEERQFKAGTSTVFLVLQRQTALLAARGSELQAQTDLNKSISNLQRATGNTLEVNNVAVRTDTPTRQLVQRSAAADTSADGESKGNSFSTSSVEAMTLTGQQQQ
jgi:HAE1 family hydrophobic/amphiphilic exporter-1